MVRYGYLRVEQCWWERYAEVNFRISSETSPYFPDVAVGLRCFVAHCRLKSTPQEWCSLAELGEVLVMLAGGGFDSCTPVESVLLF